MPKEKVLIYENQNSRKYEIRFKKDFSYGVLDSFSLENGLPAASLLANEINNHHDHITNLIIGRLRSLGIDFNMAEDFVPVQTPFIPRVVTRKAEFDG